MNRWRRTRLRIVGWFTPGRLVLVAFVANMSVVGIGLWQERRIDERDERERVSRSIVVCGEDNKGRLTDLRQTVTLASPEAIARAEEDPARLRQAIDYLAPVRPLRICTAEAIAAYFATGGVEGVQPIAWPDHIGAFIDRHRPEFDAAVIELANLGEAP